jgi:hypothetical protein
MFWHADAPVQATEHAPIPQLIGPHAIAPEHVMSQLAPCAQSMVAQASALLHLIVQANPSGHCRLPHGRPALHTMSQVSSSRSHDVHGLGQLFALARCTQYPRSQVRVMSLQSSSLVHAKSLDWRSTEQLVVDSCPSATPVRTTSTWAARITDLPGW